MTADKVVKFQPRVVGEGHRFDPDALLEANKGQGFTTLLLIGELPDGDFYVAGNCNAGEALVAMEKAKRQIVFGDVNDER